MNSEPCIVAYILLFFVKFSSLCTINIIIYFDSVHFFQLVTVFQNKPEQVCKICIFMEQAL